MSQIEYNSIRFKFQNLKENPEPIRKKRSFSSVETSESYCLNYPEKDKFGLDGWRNIRMPIS